MRRDANSGILLIGASIVSLLALLWHPTNLLSAGDNFSRQAAFAIGVHAIEIGAVVLIFNLLALHRRLGSTPDVSAAGLVAYGVSTIAMMFAAAVSGFVGTSLAGRYRGADEATQHLIHEIFHYNAMLNQTFAKVGFFAAAVALVLWSVAMLKGKSFSRGLGITGLVVGLGILIGLLTGPVVLGVHAVLLLVFGQVVWTVWVGVELMRQSPAR